MAARAPPLRVCTSLPTIKLVAEPRRALVLRADHQAAAVAARTAPSLDAQRRHPRLDEDLERRSHVPTSGPRPPTRSSNPSPPTAPESTTHDTSPDRPAVSRTGAHGRTWDVARRAERRPVADDVQLQSAAERAHERGSAPSCIRTPAATSSSKTRSSGRWPTSPPRCWACALTRGMRSTPAPIRSR